MSKELCLWWDILCSCTYIECSYCFVVQYIVECPFFATVGSLSALLLLHFLSMPFLSCQKVHFGILFLSLSHSSQTIKSAKCSYFRGRACLAIVLYHSYGCVLLLFCWCLSYPHPQRSSHTKKESKSPKICWDSISTSKQSQTKTLRYTYCTYSIFGSLILGHSVLYIVLYTIYPLLLLEFLSK